MIQPSVAICPCCANAIDLYSAEHGGAFPDAGDIEEQLTMYTDIDGNTNDSKTNPYIYGPYIRSIPSLPVGTRKGQTGIGTSDANDIGWIYTAASGSITTNTDDDEEDDSGKDYNDY